MDSNEKEQGLPDWLSAVAKSLQAVLSPFFMLVLLLFSSLLLWLPASALARVSLDKDLSGYRGLLGAVFVFSLVASGLHLGQVLIVPIKSTLKSRGRGRNIRRRLFVMTPMEQSYLIPLVEEGYSVLKAAPEDGVAAALHSKSILIRVVHTGHAIKGFEYSINPDVIGILSRESKEMLAQGRDLPRAPSVGLRGREEFPYR